MALHATGPAWVSYGELRGARLMAMIGNIGPISHVQIVTLHLYL